MFRYTCRPAGAVVYGNSGFLYTLRSAGARELDTSAFYRHIAPLERKHTYRLLGRWVGQDARPTDVHGTLSLYSFLCFLELIFGKRSPFLQFLVSEVWHLPLSLRQF